VVGLLVFFHDRFRELVTLDSRLGLGVVLMIGASIVWSTYALTQKQLLVHYGSAQVLFILYAGSIPLLLPGAHLSQLGDLSGTQLTLLVFSCVNTLVGYGCFAEALHHWQVSRVGAIVALAPLITIGGVHLLARLWPGTFAAEPLSAINLLGALMVVTGSVTCALGAADDDPAASMPEVSAEVSRQPAER
jgi:drug/metabolite transporter (DMT)-like permease